MGNGHGKCPFGVSADIAQVVKPIASFAVRSNVLRQDGAMIIQHRIVRMLAHGVESALHVLGTCDDIIIDEELPLLINTHPPQTQ